MSETNPLTRRRFLTSAGLGVAGVAGVALVGCGDDDDDDDSSSESDASNDELVLRLGYNNASGGGVNRKYMPHPETGEPTVGMDEVFSFDRNHALCRVDTNPEAFAMDTFEFGRVVVEPHTFFMSMHVTSIEQWEVERIDDTTSQCVMRGGLDCATEVGQADSKVGDREASEHATYWIEAVDAGIGGGEAGDTFAFTVFFDPEEAPVNHGIFGPEFTFTGEMTQGEITIEPLDA